MVRAEGEPTKEPRYEARALAQGRERLWSRTPRRADAEGLQSAGPLSTLLFFAERPIDLPRVLSRLSGARHGRTSLQAVGESDAPLTRLRYPYPQGPIPDELPLSPPRLCIAQHLLAGIPLTGLRERQCGLQVSLRGLEDVRRHALEFDPRLKAP